MIGTGWRRSRSRMGYRITSLTPRECSIRPNPISFLSGLRRFCIGSTSGYVPRETFRSCVRSHSACRYQRPWQLTLLAARPIPFRIAHHLRHQPGVVALLKIIADNTFGKLHRVGMQCGFWLNETSANAVWKLNPSTGGPNAFYDAGVHAVDLMFHLLPSPTMATASAQLSRFQRTVDNVSVLVTPRGLLLIVRHLFVILLSMLRDSGVHFLCFQRFPDGEPVALFPWVDEKDQNRCCDYPEFVQRL